MPLLKVLSGGRVPDSRNGAALINEKQTSGISVLKTVDAGGGEVFRRS